MMKQFFLLLLSFILLATQMSLTMGTHFCGGEAVETKIMLGETPLGCGMMDKKEFCHDSECTNNNRVRFKNIPCCKNEFQTIQGTDDFVKDAAQIVFNEEYSIAIIYTMLNFELFSSSTNNLYTDYISPLVEKDVQLLFQTFLI